MRVKLLVPAACLLLLAGCGSKPQRKRRRGLQQGHRRQARRQDLQPRSRRHEQPTPRASRPTSSRSPRPSSFDKGLSTEYQQTFDCRVRFENGKAPDVIGLQFNWSKDDLKKVKRAVTAACKRASSECA